MSKKPETFADGVTCPEPLTSIISICFTEAEKQEWNELRERIKTVNKKASIAEYGRRYLRECMADLRRSLDNIEKRSS